MSGRRNLSGIDLCDSAKFGTGGFLGSGLGGSVKEGTSGIGLGVLIDVFHYVMLCYY